MSQIALRGFVESERTKKEKYRKENLDTNKVVIFDTETTNDEYQNLTFGSFLIADKKIMQMGIFYNPKIVSRKDLAVLRRYCSDNFLKLFTLEKFIEKLFYPLVYKKQFLCVGFNLPFDLSRLAFDYGYVKGNMKGGFSFKLSSKGYSRLKIKHLDNTKSFIRFGRSFWSNFEGNFVDLKTLAVTLTDNKHIDLEKATKLFNKKYFKIKTKEHGKITEDYIAYNLNDTLATHELYENLKKELEKYGIDIPINDVYSSASLGKALLEQLGIKPFLELNNGFPKEILGYLMSAYFGGRSEVKIRKTPTKVTVIDFLSMYPTMFNIMNLWELLIAEKIEFVEDTKNVKQFVENLKLEDLQKPETWKNLNVLVQCLPESDILPIRMQYDEKEHTFNIGVNEITSKIPLWYTLPDVIVSKLLTGKVPKILRAIRFVPIDKQRLNKNKILGIKLDPNKENLFKALIEKRHKFKNKTDFREKPLKILANATSYGIFVEINTKSLEKETEVNVYSDKQFSSTVNKLEESGRYFNPIIAVLITSGARLVLGITEVLLRKHNKVYAFCDTDSMAIPSEYVKEVQEFFKPLNPYSFDKPLFKVEWENIWFYGISAKRYALYDKDGDEFTIKDDEDRGYSLHGLGHLTNPFGKEQNWHKTIWEDILKVHYELITRKQFLLKYSDLFSIAKLSVSTFEIIKRFNKLNKGKPYKKQIKPFNFFLIGIGNRDDVKPIAPYSDNPQEIVHKSFINYKTGGKIQADLKYWKNLADTLWEYINHKESKLGGDVGVLKRKHIFVDNIIHIGKETESVEETGILNLPNYPVYHNEEELKNKLAKLTPIEARLIGLNDSTLRKIKKRSKVSKVELYEKTLNRLKNLVF